MPPPRPTNMTSGDVRFPHDRWRRRPPGLGTRLFGFPDLAFQLTVFFYQKGSNRPRNGRILCHANRGASPGDTGPPTPCKAVCESPPATDDNEYKGYQN